MEGKSEEGEEGRRSPEKARSCKGYLYYSFSRKSKARNPLCIGLLRSLPQVPDKIVQQSKVKVPKEGRALVDFYYHCVGSSVYLTEKDSSAMKQHSQMQLPVCSTGIQIVSTREAVPGKTSSVPTHVHNKDGETRELPSRQTHSFLTRFARNADLVASGVVKDMKRIGKYMKETVDHVLEPCRKRPK